MDASPAVVAQEQHAPAHPEADAAPVEHMPSMGFSLITYMGSFGETRVSAISASYTLWARPGFELIGGGRFGFGPDVRGIVLDGFVAAALSPTFVTLYDEKGRTGAWRPSLAFEVGASTVKTKFDETFAAEDVQRVSPDVGAFYGSIMSRPLRFKLTGVVASALGLGVGTTLPRPGEYVRLQIEFLRVGYAF